MKINLKTIKKVYINLDGDNERNNDICNFFNSLNYSNYERFGGARLKKQARCFNIGCSTSHNQLMKKYKDHVPFILFEDDCKPTQWYNEYVVDGEIEVPDDADVIYLGYSTAGHHAWFRGQPINDKWFLLESCMATHAMIFLNKNAIETYIENSTATIKEKIALDVGYARDILTPKKLKIYAPKKVLFYQNNGCVITTHVTVDFDNNNWTSYNHNNTVNFNRQIIYDNQPIIR